MYLRKYLASDFDILNSWITDTDPLFQFAGTAWTFPLNENQIHQYQASFPERQFYMVCDEADKAFSFGEIIVGDPNSPRLGRLLIGESTSRRKGLGLKFVNMLIDECHAKIQTEILFRYVFQDNFQTIRCYEKAGFKFVPDKSITFHYNDKDYIALFMEFYFLDKK